MFKYKEQNRINSFFDYDSTEDRQENNTIIFENEFILINKSNSSLPFYECYIILLNSSVINGTNEKINVISFNYSTTLLAYISKLPILKFILSKEGNLTDIKAPINLKKNIFFIMMDILERMVMKTKQEGRLLSEENDNSNYYFQKDLDKENIDSETDEFFKKELPNENGKIKTEIHAEIDPATGMKTKILTKSSYSYSKKKKVLFSKINEEEEEEIDINFNELNISSVSTIDLIGQYKNAPLANFLMLFYEYFFMIDSNKFTNLNKTKTQKVKIEGDDSEIEVIEGMNVTLNSEINLKSLKNTPQPIFDFSQEVKGCREYINSKIFDMKFIINQCFKVIPIAKFNTWLEIKSNKKTQILGNFTFPYSLENFNKSFNLVSEDMNIGQIILSIYGIPIKISIFASINLDLTLKTTIINNIFGIGGNLNGKFALGVKLGPSIGDVAEAGVQAKGTLLDGTVGIKAEANSLCKYNEEIRSTITYSYKIKTCKAEIGVFVKVTIFGKEFKKEKNWTVYSGKGKNGEKKDNIKC